MEYSNIWNTKERLAKGSFNKVWTGFREIKWMRSIPGPTAGSHRHPRPEGGVGSAWLWAVKRAAVRRGLCDRSCALQWRHAAAPQGPSRRDSGEVPFSPSPSGTTWPESHQAPKGKGRSRAWSRADKGAEGIQRQAGSIQPRLWTWFHKLQYSHTMDYYAAIFVNRLNRHLELEI